mmetsp:Transcript_73806/g.117675  ORF Transcript_73806/g.117675 Transcript_73806/m.117675 type:complete len:132 (-) Transcript_73806:55-450(-)
MQNCLLCALVLLGLFMCDGAHYPLTCSYFRTVLNNGQCRYPDGSMADDHTNFITMSGLTLEECQTALEDQHLIDEAYVWAEHSGDSRGMCWIGISVGYTGNDNSPYKCWLLVEEECTCTRHSHGSWSSSSS